MKRIYLFLGLIFLLGLILRFYLLGGVPVGFHTDEAYFGYNAYSILKTGREITGDFLPLHLKSFLFSPALYSYFSILPISVFGLNEFSTRFASAIFGVLTIPLTFIFARLLLEKSKNKDLIALSSALFMAISPWHINLSRVSTENVAVVFLILAGSCLYILWDRTSKLYFLILSFLLFLTSIFTYQAPRSFLPFFLILLTLFCLFSDKKINLKKFIIPAAFYLVFVILPVILIILSPNLSFRIRTLSILQNPKTQLVLDEQIREDGIANVTPIAARIFHNKIIDYSQTFLNNYFDHFSYEFLFTDAGLPERYKVPGSGLMYLFDLPLLIIGFYFLFNKNRLLGVLLTGWVVLSPIGSALTFDDVPNLQRTLLIFPSLPIISAYGFSEVIVRVSRIKNKGKPLIYASFICIIFYSFTLYLHAYYVQQIVHRPWYRQEGYKKMIAEIKNFDDKYDKTVITEFSGSPSIFIFFFDKYDPAYVQKIIRSANSFDYGSVSFGKYKITKEDCPVSLKKDSLGVRLIGEKNTLYVVDGRCSVPKGVKELATIRRNDDTIVFKLLALDR